MKLKVCTKCGAEKLASEFYSEARAADKKRTSCKSCDTSRRVKRMTGMTVDQYQAYQAQRKTHYQEIKLTAQEYSAMYRLRHRAKNLVWLARARAKKKSLPFDLNQHMPEIQARIDAGFCEISGLQLQLDQGRIFASPSLDRIEPKKGYVYRNIRVVCHAMNCAMGDWGEDRLMEVMQAWIKKRG